MLKRVDAHYNRLRTLRARFVEHYAGMGMDRTESGTLEMAKPGRMRWAYDRPVGKLFVMDGKFGWSYTPGDGQVQRIPAKKLDDLRSPLRLLLGHTQLATELQGVSVSCRLVLSMRSRGFRGGWDSGSVEVDGAGGWGGGNSADASGRGGWGRDRIFVFRGDGKCVPIAAGEFVFAAPAGVGVVDGIAADLDLRRTGNADSLREWQTERQTTR